MMKVGGITCLEKLKGFHIKSQVLIES